MPTTAALATTAALLAKGEAAFHASLQQRRRLRTPFGSPG